MTSRKRRRIVLIASLMSALSLATGLVLYALKDGIVFFYSPQEVVEKGLKPGTRFRLGGLVETGSLIKAGSRISFSVSDGTKAISVHYQGLLPDLFREGQGVVAEGMLDGSGAFQASTILAKHDETYMPREVAEALKKQGHWQGQNGQGKEVSKEQKPSKDAGHAY